MKQDAPLCGSPPESSSPFNAGFSPEQRPVGRAADLCKGFTLASGFNFFFFSFQPPPAAGVPPAVVLTNYPEKWLELYQQRAYGKIDPVAQKLKTAVLPFTWDSLAGEDPRVHDLFREAAAHGLAGGACFPMFGPRAARAALTLAGGTLPAAEKLRETFFAQAWLFGLRVFHNLLNSADGAEPAADASSALTGRQQQILTSFAEGLSYREVAMRHQIKHSTVQTLLARCCTKLGVATREQAIAKAAATGLLPLGAPTSLGFHGPQVKTRHYVLDDKQA